MRWFPAFVLPVLQNAVVDDDNALKRSEWFRAFSLLICSLEGSGGAQCTLMYSRYAAASLPGLSSGDKATFLLRTQHQLNSHCQLDSITKFVELLWEKPIHCKFHAVCFPIHHNQKRDGIRFMLYAFFTKIKTITLLAIAGTIATALVLMVTWAAQRVEYQQEASIVKVLVGNLC